MLLPFRVRNKHRRSSLTARAAFYITGLITPFATYGILSGILTDWTSFWPALRSLIGSMESGLQDTVRALSEPRAWWVWTLLFAGICWVVPTSAAVVVYVAMRLLLLPARVHLWRAS